MAGRYAAILIEGRSALAWLEPREARRQLEQQRQEAARRQPQQRPARQSQPQSGLPPRRSSPWTGPRGPALRPVPFTLSGLGRAAVAGKAKRAGT